MRLDRDVKWQGQGPSESQEGARGTWGKYRRGGWLLAPFPATSATDGNHVANFLGT